MKIELSMLDDDPEYLELVRTPLQELGYTGSFFSQIPDFEQSLDELPRVIILDYYLGGRTGVDVMRKVKDKHPISTFIIMSSQMAPLQLIDIINVGWGCYYVNKGAEVSDAFIKELCNKIDLARNSMDTKLRGVFDAKKKVEEMKLQAFEVLKIIDTKQ